MKKFVVCFATGIVLTILLFVSFRIGYNKGKENVEVSHDTVIVIRERLDLKPVEKMSLTYSDIQIPKVLVRNDTIVRIVIDSSGVDLPIEHKVFSKDNEYEVGISGVSPMLDYVKTFNTQQFITKEVKVPTKKKFSFGVQLGVGPTYGLINRKFDIGVYFGIGGAYNF